MTRHAAHLHLRKLIAESVKDRAKESAIVEAIFALEDAIRDQARADERALWQAEERVTLPVAITSISNLEVLSAAANARGRR